MLLAVLSESMLSPWMAWALASRGRIQLIDLREEQDLPRIACARAIPLDELPHELSTLDRERPVVFVSGDDGMAAEAMQVLRAAGVTTNAVAGAHPRLARRRAATPGRVRRVAGQARDCGKAAAVYSRMLMCARRPHVEHPCANSVRTHR